MKRILLYYFLVSGLSVTGQTCPSSALTLSSQSAVNSFAATYPGCIHVPVSVTITSPAGAITSLAGLSQITTIEGGLTINSNLLLTNLTGLDNLTAIGGGLTISSNAALLDIGGIGSVTTVGGDLGLTSNTTLANLGPLTSVTQIAGELRVTGNPLVLNLHGLDNINPTTISNLVIQSSTGLVFCGVTSICLYLSTPSNTYTISGNGTGCSTFAQLNSSCGGALPVELVDFTVKAEGSSAVLDWKTVSETDNAGFEVQRSKDLANWEVLGFVAGKGSSFEENDYHFMDANPPVGMNYYRLNQLDINGNSRWSPTMSVIIYPGRDIGIFPNPTTGKAYLTASKNEQIATVTDQLGRTLKTSAGQEIDLSELPKGVYFVAVAGGESVMSYKVVRE